MADELDRDRTDAASAADDENRGARHRVAYPCGRARLMPDNTLVNEMKLSVGADIIERRLVIR